MIQANAEVSVLKISSQGAIENEERATNISSISPIKHRILFNVLISVKKNDLQGDTSFDCDFEKNLCGWKSEGDFDWKRMQGSGSSSAWQPSVDITMGTADGWYVFVDSALPNLKDQTSRLRSVPFTKGANSIR